MLPKILSSVQSIAAYVVAAIAACLLLACSESGPALHGVNLSGAQYGKDFELTDHHGQVRHLKDFSGKVVVLFFGYTQCPDVCPTSMLELTEVKKALGQDAERLQVLFVTLDPERDTPEILQAYMNNFDPTFLALYTTPEKLVQLTQDYKVYYRKVPGKTPTSYTLDHSAGSYVYDTKGQLRLFVRYGSKVQDLLADIAALLKTETE